MAPNIYSIPFSFNGPCASLSGAGAMYNAVQNRDYGVRSMLLNQRFDESPREYLRRVRGVVSASKRCIVLAGNHLSCLPIHEIALERGLFRIVLDAHRDYTASPIGSPTHANFLGIAGEMRHLVFYGYRDGPHDDACIAGQYSCADTNGLKSFIGSLPKTTRFYVDVDLDVIDPSVFPATGCPLPDGLSVSAVLGVLGTIGLSRIDIVSFEEYIPLADSNGKCLETIILLLDHIMKEWR